jgi:acetyl-CoA carboxylase alpha subunit
MATLLQALARAQPRPPPATLPASLESGVSAWESVRRTRDPERPSSRELLKQALTDFTILRGDRAGGKDDTACLAMVGRFLGRPVVVVGSDRGLGVEVERIGVSGLRKARRALRLASQLGLPAVTLIDTPGAETTAEAEEEGLAQGIATCISTMLAVTTPTVSVILGQGSGGGALALLPGDRVIAAEHGWLSPIAPEGASVIVHGTVTRAAEMAEAQGIVANRLLAAGIVDTVVPEAGGLLVERLIGEIARALDELAAEADEVRNRRRGERYRQVGATPGSRTL